MIKGRLVNTLLLGGIGFILTFGLALLLGIFCVYYENQLPDRILRKVGTITSCIPEFWLSLILILIFSVNLKLLPGSGAYDFGQSANPLSRLTHLILPLTVVVLSHLWYYAYLIRNRLLEETRKDYVLLAKAKGNVTKKSIVLSLCENIMPSFISLMAISLQHVIEGTYIVEMVFSYPGIGTLSFESAKYHDYNMLMVLCVFTGIFVIAGNVIGQQCNNANRLHIALFGKRNSGKSSLINALTGQDTALVSDTPGTTTDPVQKAMEIHGIGPCLFIDTPGFDDEGELGNRRIERTWKAVEKTDIALLLCAGGSSAEETGEPDFTEELHWLEQLKAKNIPTILLINKADIRKNTASLAIRIKETFGSQPIPVSAKEKTGIELIRQAILEKLPEDFDQQSIAGNPVTEGDLVLLVMPQDIQAPKGRLILPQVQTMRELLDKKCLIMSCTTDKLRETLQALSRPPKLIITDSQVFKTVYEQKPEESRLTSFSVLFAGYKGDIRYYVKSASAIGSLTESSRVLIAEACTHAPLSEDIGRVKLPHLLRKRIGEKLSIDIVAGTDFPQDLTPYSLVIHCGACMFNRKYVLNRIERARLQNVPMTNYGVAIAFLNGILNQIEY